MLAAQFPEIISRIDDQNWVERHLPRIFELIAAPAGSEAVEGYMSRLAALGIWAAEDMLVASGGCARCLIEKYPGRAAFWAGHEVFKRLDSAGRSAVRGLKLFTDGALGARTAALSRGYRTGGKGMLLHTDDELDGLLRSAAGLASRVAIHAIGDAALEQVISALERPAAPRRTLETRIEHAQFITRDQALRAKKLGVTLCMQPNFSSDSVCYADRLPARYRGENNPFRMLIDEAGFVPGGDLVFGSDGMPHGAQAALEGALFPPFAGQRLKLEEFIAGYCLSDLKAGWIAVEIDENKKKVGVKVVNQGI